MLLAGTGLIRRKLLFLPVHHTQQWVLSCLPAFVEEINGKERRSS